MSFESWILLSAFFLAIYDLCKKAAVRDNAVLPVLTITTFAGAVAYIATLSACGALASSLRFTPKILWFCTAKTVIVGSSWIFTYCALRTLPVTIATPIRASAPALVILVAFFLYGERPSWLQWSGMALTFAGFYAFSWAGRHEGIDFRHSKAVWFAVAGLVLSAVSSLWDKYIFQVAAAPVEPVQFGFQVGLFVFYSLMMIGQRVFLGPSRHHFEWRPTIPFVGVILALADWLYFHGLAVPGAPISVGSLLRRFSVAITFVFGAFLFRETNLRRKTVALILLLAGTALICIGH